jgi:glyoxylase-like metal-dependent hydrolase (beta-lactamase superfamily II)
LISTPGHTDGHVCLVQREMNIIFTGDHVLPDSAVNITIQQQSVHAAPLAEYLASLEKMMALRPGMKGMPGHGAPIPDVRSRCFELQDLYLHRVEQVRSVLAAKPASAFDISCRAFGAKRRAFSRWLGMAQAITCLEYLEQHGEASCQRLGNNRTYSCVDIKNR